MTRANATGRKSFSQYRAEYRRAQRANLAALPDQDLYDFITLTLDFSSEVLSAFGDDHPLFHEVTDMRPAGIPEARWQGIFNKWLVEHAYPELVYDGPDAILLLSAPQEAIAS
jgi:hypothetical protein